jgi:hypothetical protein
VTGGAFQTTALGRDDDAFVAQLSADGSRLVYATYLGGSGIDYANGIAVDGQGQAYVTGGTDSSDFPVTGSAFQTTAPGGNDDAFVAQLNADGSRLAYATYLGGNNYDVANGIAVDGNGQAYVTGYTNSADFPVTGSAFQTALRGDGYAFGDAFVAQLSADGSQLLYATYLGGNDYDEAYGIAVDGQGQAYVAGEADSTDFPVTAGAFQTAPSGNGDAFIAKLSFSASCPGEHTTTVINVRRSGYRRSRSTGDYLQQLTLTNTGSAPIAGPLGLVVDNLSANATVANGSGKTTCAAPVGSPYVSVALSGNTLNPGQSATVTLELANPTNQAMSYTTRVLVLNLPPA